MFLRQEIRNNKRGLKEMNYLFKKNTKIEIPRNSNNNNIHHFLQELHLKTNWR